MSQNVGALESEINQYEEMTITGKIKYINSISARDDNPHLANVIVALSEAEYEALPDDASREGYIQSLKDRVPTFATSSLDPIEMVTLYEALQNPANAVFTYNDDPDDDIDDGWTMSINLAADSVFLEEANVGMRVSLRLAITVLPCILILAAWMLLKKKYVIDEKYYDQINQEINAKKQSKSESNA
jgi:hypothetical protein